MYLIKMRNQDMYYGGYMFFYDGIEKGFVYSNLDDADNVLEAFRKSGVDLELVTINKDNKDIKNT